MNLERATTTCQHVHCKGVAAIPHAELEALFRVRDYCRVTGDLSCLSSKDRSKRGRGSRTTRHSFLDSTDYSGNQGAGPRVDSV